MSYKVDHIHEEYLSIYKIFLDIMNNRWKIITFVIVSVLGVFIFQLTQPQGKFNAITKINTVSLKEIEKYSNFNSLNYFEISQASLMNKYIERLDDLTIYKKAILKYDLLDVTSYEDNDEFNQAVNALALSIKIDIPLEKGKFQEYLKTNNNFIFQSLDINFQYSDVNKWQQAMLYIDELANLAVKEDLQYQFESLMMAEQNNKNFALEGINKKIENAKADYDKELLKLKMNNEFDLEDVMQQIKNVISFYEVDTYNRLAFLKEQAAIARKLSISNFTFMTQEFSENNKIIASITNQPFYMNGYIAIEKEAELILSRTDMRPFIDELPILEKQKKLLEDQKEKLFKRSERKKLFTDSIKEFEIAKRSIEQDIKLEFDRSIFSNTPIVSNDEFSSVVMAIQKTNFEYQNNSTMILLLTALISGFISIIYITFVVGLRNYELQLLKD